MRRLGYSLVVGAAGAGLVHLAIVLALPAVSAENTWNGVKQALPRDRMVRSGLPVFAPDPFFRVAACRVDLREGAVRVTASGSVSAWSLSVYAPDGSGLASFSDRSAPTTLLDLRLVSPALAGSAEAAPPANPPLEVDAEEALVVLEVFVPDKSWSAATEAFLSSAACQRAAEGQ